jgi:Protein of unknown function (DUF1549)
MRRIFVLVLLAAGLLTPLTVSAQELSRERAIADFYWRTGQHGSAYFYIQLAEAREKKEPPKQSGTLEPPKHAGSLDVLIAEALKNNPDIRVAESKVREVEAELNRTRMKVASDVAFLQAEIQAAKAMMEESLKRYQIASQLHNQKAIAREEFGVAELAFNKAKAELLVKEAKLPYLLGRQPGARAGDASLDDLLKKKWLDQTKNSKITYDEWLRRATLDVLGRLPTQEEIQKFSKMPEKDRCSQWIDQLLKNEDLTHIRNVTREFGDPGAGTIDELWRLYSKPASPLTDKLRKALDAPITLKAENMKLKDVMDYVQDEHLRGINLVVRASSLKKDPITIMLGEPIPLGAFLQYLEDELGCVFVLRDYGIVVTSSAERLPPGAVRVTEVWKHGKAAEAKKDTTEKK